MITTILVTIALLLIAAVAWFYKQRWPGAEYFANALIAKTHHFGRITRLVDATGVFTSRYLICKEGATAGSTIALCGTTDIPLGVVPDMTPSTDTDTSYPLPVHPFGGVAEETYIVIASAAIAVGDFVVPAASGQARTLPATTGSYYVIGRALTAAAAQNDQVEIVPMLFLNRVP